MANDQDNPSDQPSGQSTAQPTVQPTVEPNHVNPSSVNRLQVKVPPFWKQNPQLWFRQLEAQFANSNITIELTKFNHIVGIIESDVLDHVSDIVLAPPINNQYEAIKKRLIEAFAPSDNKKLKSLLNDITLGDSKPSDLLRRMRELSCNKVSNELLKTLWLQRLPSTIQAILATKTDDLDVLSKSADIMHEVTEASSIQAVNTAHCTKLNDLVNVVCKLEGKIESLKRDFRDPGHRSRQTSQSRSPTPSKAPSVTNKGLCYYHKHYGKKASKCKQPCTWVAPKSKN